MPTTPSIIGIAGMPGSGKSRITTPLQQEGFVIYDDFNNEGPDVTCARVLAMIADYEAGRNVAANESMFCTQDWRSKFARIFPLVRWISFVNNPHQCKLNCVERAQTMPRNLNLEFQLIDELTPIYQPAGEVRQIHVARTGTPPTLPRAFPFDVVPRQIFPNINRQANPPS